MNREPPLQSTKDPRVVAARELTSASGRARAGRCLLEGEECVRWALDADLPIEHVFVHDRGPEPPLVETLQQRGIPVFPASEAILRKITDTSYLIPLVGVAMCPVRSSAALDDDLIVVLDRVRDHGNLGTIVRTASAFGVRQIVSTSPDLDLYYRKIVDASRGKVFAVDLHCFSDGAEAIRHLKANGYQVVVTSPYGNVLQPFTPLAPRPVALVVGNETEGVSDEVTTLADLVVQIPMSGEVESLNVGVATGISIYELKMRLIMTMLTQTIRGTLGRQVNVTSKMIQAALDVELKKVSELSSIQVILMMILKCDQTMTLEQAHRDTGAVSGELPAILDPLIERGYIQREMLGQAAGIRLTQTGETTLAQLWNVVEQAENHIMRGFSPAEREAFGQFLERIQQNCLQIIDP